MRQKILPSLLASVLLLISASVSEAQEFKVGDTIYVNAYYGGCVKAKVLQTEPAYYVNLEEGMYKGSNTFYNANRLKECKQAAEQNNQQQDNQNRGDGNQPGQERRNVGNVRIGDRVDVYLSDNKEAKARGTIIEADGSQYKIRYEGCGDGKDVVENAMFIRPAATVPADDAEIKFLVGRWSMITTAISDGGYWAWGKSPGIQINADGTYVWYQEGGKPPVKGKWTPHAKMEGARKYGAYEKNGVIIKDANGAEWKMSQTKSLRDNTDRITLFMMCQGRTQNGSRVQ